MRVHLKLVADSTVSLQIDGTERKEICRHATCIWLQHSSGAHPASYPVGTGGSSPGLERPESKADHYPPPSGEVKNEWSYTSTPPMRIRNVVLNQARDTSSWRGA